MADVTFTVELESVCFQKEGLTLLENIPNRIADQHTMTSQIPLGVDTGSASASAPALLVDASEWNFSCFA
jgi:hypothetical protein